jgi:hypothetical protein
MSFSEFTIIRYRHALLILTICAGTLASSSALAQALAVVTSAHGAIEQLDRGLAEQLFLGRRTTLADGRSVQLIDLPAGTDRDRFYISLTRKNPSQIRAYWSRLVFTGRAQPPREAGSTAEAIKWVSENTSAVTYIPTSETPNPSLRILFTLE